MQNPPTTITAHTVALLKTRPVTLDLDTIAGECKVSKSWLNLLIAGKYKEPGADKIQRLYEFLSKKPLLNKEPI